MHEPIKGKEIRVRAAAQELSHMAAASETDPLSIHDPANKIRKNELATIIVGVLNSCKQEDALRTLLVVLEDGVGRDWGHKIIREALEKMGPLTSDWELFVPSWLNPSETVTMLIQPNSPAVLLELIFNKHPCLQDNWQGLESVALGISSANVPFFVTSVMCSGFALLGQEVFDHCIREDCHLPSRKVGVDIANYFKGPPRNVDEYLDRFTRIFGSGEHFQSIFITKLKFFNGFEGHHPDRVTRCPAERYAELITTAYADLIHADRTFRAKLVSDLSHR